MTDLSTDLTDDPATGIPKCLLRDLSVIPKADAGQLAAVDRAIETAAAKQTTAMPEQLAIEQWAARVNSAWCRSVAGIIEVGDVLIAAKADLGHGKWGELFASGALPFGMDTAQRLMSIARNPWLVNTAKWRDLPASYRTLSELAKLTDQQLDAGLTKGIIQPEMKFDDVERLQPKTKLKTKTKKTKPETKLKTKAKVETESKPDIVIDDETEVDRDAEPEVDRDAEPEVDGVEDERQDLIWRIEMRMDEINDYRETLPLLTNARLTKLERQLDAVDITAEADRQ
jgi:hypothetical protein